MEKKVGIGEYKIAENPDLLIAYGLGSCIGVILYDNVKKIGGLLHIMLPDSTQFNKVENPFKFADLGIPLLLREMEKKGCSQNLLQVKIAGGSSMFNFGDKSLNMDIGTRNYLAVKNKLEQLNITIDKEDVGGSCGRTLMVDTLTGKVTIRTVGKDTKEL
ncbi:MAG: chemotaxis protein CheD [Clostridiaceae bacterium]